jgi:hypothetical protein
MDLAARVSMASRAMARISRGFVEWLLMRDAMRRCSSTRLKTDRIRDAFRSLVMASPP